MSTRSNSSCPPNPFGYVIDGSTPVDSCQADSAPGTTPVTTGAMGELGPASLVASPIAAWGYSIPLPQGVTLADLVPSDSSRVVGPKQPNADYEVLVVESPWLATPGSAARADDPVNPPVLKKILLNEFLTEYVGEVRSYTFNVRGGSGIDESATINALFQWILEQRLDSPMRAIIRARNPLDSIYINRLVTCYANNVTIEFRSPVVYGAGGGLRLMGDQPEIIRGATYKAKLANDAAEGATTLALSTTGGGMQASDFIDGDVIIIRGQNDASGKALSKQVLHIVSRDTILNTLTVQESLEEDYDVIYPDSDWPADLTTGTTISLAAFAGATGDWARGDQTVAVNPTQLATSGIRVGSIVLVSTSETEFDLNPHAHNASGDPYKNSARLEIKKILALTSSTVTFDSPLVDNYALAWHAGITLYAPIENSSIMGVRARYNADQPTRNIHGIQVGYACGCRVEDCQIDGSQGQRGSGIRISNSRQCQVNMCRVTYPKYVGSGEGYGIAIYYTDECRVLNTTAEGCRHNFLLQKANHTTVALCTSINDGISGIDLHGVNSIRTHIHGCRLLGGPAYYDSTQHKSLLRVGNTSHAAGDRETFITGCFLSGAQLGPSHLTYAALEVFGASTDVTMTGSFITDCQCGIRGGYDNLAGSGEDDAIARLMVRGNAWRNITVLKDLKSTSTVDLDDGGLTKFAATLTNDQTFTSVIDTTLAPDITAGAQLFSTSYTTKAPNRTIKVECIIPGLSTGGATCAAITLWAGSTCIGAELLRIQTTGANSGCSMRAAGFFVGSGAAQTIQVRFGPNTAQTFTLNSRFANHATQQPTLVITEMP